MCSRSTLQRQLGQLSGLVYAQKKHKGEGEQQQQQYKGEEEGQDEVGVYEDTCGAAEDKANEANPSPPAPPNPSDMSETELFQSGESQFEDRR
jgi:hypothetical protein